jgi:hypothetical protein
MGGEDVENLVHNVLAAEGVEVVHNMRVTSMTVRARRFRPTSA